MNRNTHTIAIAAALLAAASLTAADKVTYEDDVLPIFRNKCLKCHNADKMKADLDLSTYGNLSNNGGLSTNGILSIHSSFSIQCRFSTDACSDDKRKFLSISRSNK